MLIIHWCPGSSACIAPTLHLYHHIMHSMIFFFFSMTIKVVQFFAILALIHWITEMAIYLLRNIYGKWVYAPFLCIPNHMLFRRLALFQIIPEFVCCLLDLFHTTTCDSCWPNVVSLHMILHGFWSKFIGLILILRYQGSSTVMWTIPWIPRWRWLLPTIWLANIECSFWSSFNYLWLFSVLHMCYLWPGYMCSF
jgi:hypothetical protein